MTRCEAHAALVAVGLAVCACGPTPSRVPRQLGSVSGVCVTNSPMLAEELEPERDGDRLWVTYSVVFENRGLSPVAMRLDDATLAVSGRTLPTRCAVYEGAPRTFGPGERWRVDCELDLDARAQQELEHRDLDADLRMPLLVATDAVSVEFRYPFRVGDGS